MLSSWVGQETHVTVRKAARHVADARLTVAQTERYAATLLSPLEKLVINLRLDGLPPRQIAQRLNLPPKKVENALTRARRKLRQL